MGPLIDESAVDHMLRGARSDSRRRRRSALRGEPLAWMLRRAGHRASAFRMPILKEEIFAPILLSDRVRKAG